MYSLDMDNLAAAHCLLRQTTTEFGYFYRRVISGAAVFFKRMVQKVKCALEIAAADGQQGQNRQALFGDNLQHDFIPFVFFMKNLPLS